MTMRTACRRVATAAGIALGLAGVATANPGAAQDAQQHVIDIRDFTFDPPSPAVAVGDTVTWTNRDLVPHTVTGGGIDSGPLTEGQTWTVTITEPGGFDYACRFHPVMKGVITVD